MKWRWLGFVFLVLLLTGSAFAGTIDVIGLLHDANGPGQWMVAATELAYSLCAVLALSAMGARNRNATGFLTAWCVTVVMTATVAPVAYGNTPVVIGFASGAMTAVVCAIVLWIWRHRPDGLNGQ